MKPNTILITAAFRELHGEGDFAGVLIDAATGHALASDGEALAVHPLPTGHGFDRTLFLPAASGAQSDLTVSPGDGEEAEAAWGIEDIEAAAGTPAYRLALNPLKLLQLAAAIGGTSGLTLELPAEPGAPVRVKVPGSAAFGYLMPLEGEDCGLLIATPAATTPTSSLPTSPVPAPIGPPLLRLNEERKGLELLFAGKPDAEIREAIKDQGFRWHRQEKIWYAKDTEARRAWVKSFLQAEAA